MLRFIKRLSWVSVAALLVCLVTPASVQAQWWIPERTPPTKPIETHPVGGIRGNAERLDWDSRSAMVIPEELVDPPFDRYVDMALVANAVGDLDPVLLTDVALQIAEGEKILCRPHKGISADKLFELAVKVAADKQDKDTLARLKKAGKVLDKKNLAASVDTATKLAGESRAVDPASLVPIDCTSEETFWSLKNYMDSIRRARLLGDVESIERLKKSLAEETTLPHQQLDYLKKISGEARAAMPDKPDSETVTLMKLMSETRGWLQDATGGRVTTPGWVQDFGKASSTQFVGIHKLVAKARFSVVNNTRDKGKVLHVRVFRDQSPGRDGSKKYHFEIPRGKKMTFSGTRTTTSQHGSRKSNRQLYIEISYFDQRSAKPRKRIYVDDGCTYVISGKRGDMSWSRR